MAAPVKNMRTIFPTAVIVDTVSTGSGTDVPLPPPFGTGFFLGAQSFAAVSEDTGDSAASTGVANEIVAVQLDLIISYTISAVAMKVMTGKGSTLFMCAGLYDITGNTLLIDAGNNAFDCGTASQKYRSVTLAAPVTISPGSYLYAVGATSTGGTVLCHNKMAQFTDLVNGLDFTLPQVLPTRLGIAANSIVSGSMPATLGALTPIYHTSPVSVPVLMFVV
jgi:hypothetical protein